MLVVESDPDLRARMASWFEDEGYIAMTCPGPTAPGYDCVGLRSGGCALAKGAQIVVLDSWTDTDRASAGPGGRRLLSFYSRLGLPVVLVQPGRGPEPEADDWLVEVEWPPDRRELLETTAALRRLRADDRTETP